MWIHDALCFARKISSVWPCSREAECVYIYVCVCVLDSTSGDSAVLYAGLDEIACRQVIMMITMKKKNVAMLNNAGDGMI